MDELRELDAMPAGSEVEDPYEVLGLSPRASRREVRQAAGRHRDPSGQAAAALLLDSERRAVDGRLRGVLPPSPTSPALHRVLILGGVLCLVLTVALLVGAAIVRPLGPESGADAKLAMLIGAGKAAAGAYLCLRYEQCKAEWAPWRSGSAGA